MKLLNLQTKNYRGAAPLSINPQGKNVNLYGQNGAGKTTAEDAYLWLLFGKDSADKKDFDLIPHKPGTAESDVGQGKEPFVEASFEYFGKAVKLKKTYIEEWPTKGELKGKYAGSKVHYYVDDLEVRATEYQQIVSELVDDKLFKLISNPHHFSDVLSWQERRETLIRIAGDLNVEMPKDLASLAEARSFDKFYAFAKQCVKDKLKELDGLPYAISEAKRLISENLPAAPDIDALKARKDKLEADLLSAKSDNLQRREAAQIETEISEARNRYTAVIDEDNSKIRAGIEKLESEKRGKDQELSTAARTSTSTAADIIDLTAKKTRKLAEWHNVNNCSWMGSDKCPTCGQTLPEDQIEDARAKFNRQRSENLERLKSEGLALKSAIEAKQTEINDAAPLSLKITEEIATLAARIEKGRGMIKQADFNSTDEYRILKAKLDTVSSAPTDDTTLNLNTALSDISTEISAAQRIKDQHKQNDEQVARVDALKAQEEQRNAELQRWEKGVYLCEQHVKRVAKALEQAVNGKFKIARFRLFVTLKNGEEAECCDVIYPNGSTNLSTGERLQVGVDIINTLTEFYGVDAPIWIDNAEGVTLPIECSSQLIRMIVSDADKTLRVEIEE